MERDKYILEILLDNNIPNVISNLIISYEYRFIGNLHSTFNSHNNYSNPIKILDDGRIVNIPSKHSNDYTIKIYNPKDNSEVKLIGHTNEIYFIKIFPNDRIFTASQDRTLKVWNTKNGHCKLSLINDISNINIIHYNFVLSDNRIISCEDKMLKIWNPENGECTNTFTFDTYTYTYIDVLSDNRIKTGNSENKDFTNDRIISYSKYSIKIWNLENNLCELTFDNGEIYNSKILPNDRFITESLLYPGTITIWNLKNGRCEYKIDYQKSIKSSYHILSDGNIVTFTIGEKTKNWNTKTGNCEYTLNNSTVNRILPDDRIISGSIDGELKIWNAKNGNCDLILTGHNNTICDIKILSDGRIATSSKDYISKDRIIIWNLKNGNCDFNILCSCDSLKFINSLPDGRIVTRLKDRYLTIYNMKNGEPELTLFDHTDEIYHIETLPDGKIITCSLDKTIKIWS